MFIAAILWIQQNPGWCFWQFHLMNLLPPGCGFNALTELHKCTYLQTSSINISSMWSMFIPQYVAENKAQQSCCTLGVCTSSYCFEVCLRSSAAYVCRECVCQQNQMVGVQRSTHTTIMFSGQKPVDLKPWNFPHVHWKQHSDDTLKSVRVFSLFVLLEISGWLSECDICMPKQYL